MKGWSLSFVVIGWLLGLAGGAGAADYGIYLDGPEQAAQAETWRYAMEHNQINQESTWVNPETGHGGSITPVRNFYSSQGLYCREYFQTLRSDASLERLLGVACRPAEGVWEVMHEQFLSDAYLELEASPYTYVERDPYDHYYPWVYYDPIDYPHPIYFSFVFTSPRHHFEPRHFHSGHRFHTPHFRDGRHLAPRPPLQRDQRRKQQIPAQTDDGTRLRRGGDGDEGRSQRGETLRREERGNDEDRGRRGKETRGSQRRERDREDQDERSSGSDGQGRGQR